MKNLNVKGTQVFRVIEDSDPIDIVIKKHIDHPSIFKTKKFFNEPTECNFSK